jgi:hypothetical protein
MLSSMHLYGNGHPVDHYVEFAQGADQVMVWVGLTRAGVVLGPHFAERNLNTREYLRIIRYHVIQRDFYVHNIDRNNMWWQQDGAPAHTSNATPSRTVSSSTDEQTYVGIGNMRLFSLGIP